MTPDETKSFTDWVFSQGVGVVFGALMAWVYIKERRQLVGILRERKTDRDSLLVMLGRLDAHLSRASIVEQVARGVLADAVNPDIPKRREADRLVLAALEREYRQATGGEAREREPADLLHQGHSRLPFRSR